MRNARLGCGHGKEVPDLCEIGNVTACDDCRGRVNQRIVSISAKIEYRGYQVECNREDSLGGESLLYYSIYRLSDMYECESSFTSDDSTPEAYADLLKQRIDAELLEADPWMEKEGI